MREERVYPVFKRLDTLEWKACNRLARLGAYRPLLRVLRLASRLGDAPAWVALCFTVPIFRGLYGWLLAVCFGLSAAVGGLFYRFVKNRLCRERPYISFEIPCTMPPLDRYSFPSGHTLHAVMFTTLFATYVPILLIIVLPFAILVMLSRVILGLHYLTDVAAGALIGFLLAEAWVGIITWLTPLLPLSLQAG
ncbi:phosphatase PAP2 family protein [Kushneria phosphatilytica]|uniref:undecaprenyl-diphosphate phosphatase n=1 Tax=Kushneria phosphatilytica TaxID=657387 RepID=A0A1S1P0H2_9GAMM|nr:phosphatase PAP2 family protein [Kushneria phosphatilytica]OHV11975.1 phosphatase PAP2 family protein [Kushneria phosphatilytica]QEL11160.1 phosphatase PAP2 family protein [Kushneria phosphatilytica]